MYNESMKNKRENLKIIFIKFIELARKKDIWFAMDNNSMLGVVRHSGFVPWEEKIQIMMTIESYNKLKRIAPKQIATSSTDKRIHNLKAYFVENNKIINKDQAFIEIRILVPTTLKKIKLFKSLLKRTIDLMKRKQKNNKKFINDLYAKRFEGFLPLESTSQNIAKSWIQTLTFKTVNKKFNELDVPIPVEYKEILSRWFGNEYMKTSIPKKYKEYHSPIKTTKEVL